MVLDGAPSALALPQSKQKRASSYVPALDALRLFAFLSVFFRHTGELHSTLPLVQLFVSAGGFGVCLFFALSAYLITDLLIQELAVSGTIDVRAFYVRRTLRIWPLYFCLLGAVIVVGIYHKTFYIPHMQIVASAFFFANWYFAKNGWPASNPIAHFWSISVEEQFYLLWPNVVKRFGISASTVAAWLCMPIGLLFTLVLAERKADPDTTIWCNTFVQFFFFSEGAAIAFALAKFAKKKSNALTALLWPMGVLAWLFGARCGVLDMPLTSGVQLCLGYLAVGLGCAAFLLGALSLEDRFVPKPVAYLGKISYGLYLFHAISLALVRSAVSRFELGVWITNIPFVAISLALTIAVSHLSYQYLEKPFLKLKERFTIVKSRPI
jgi:peptidoglycan/LPS O-acetylase OafA/YrhL